MCLDSINKKYFIVKSIEKIKENIHYCNKPGMIIASPSDDPPYKFHWIRDASIVMRTIIDQFETTNSDASLLLLFNYINNEYEIQNLNTIGSLGEPKININGKPFNESWGRPQNDGPALRGTTMIKLYKLLIQKYSSFCNTIVLTIIKKDLIYTLNKYQTCCFDIWEEEFGWHFYTRMVQLKFLKDALTLDVLFDEFSTEIEDAVANLSTSIFDHYNGDIIISSFNESGEITKVDDTAILFAYIHTDFDEKIVELFPIDKITKTCENLHTYFDTKYNSNNLSMIGRYPNDKYYNGQLWIICSLALVQIYMFINKTKYIDYITKIVIAIISIDFDLTLAEQYDPINKKQVSAKKLTWNYAELYFTLLKL
jgi:glucoamylase